MTDIRRQIFPLPQACLAALYLMLAAMAAHAQEDAADEAPSDAQVEARTREISAEIARREAALEELRYAGGIYAAALQETYADLGAYLLSVDEYEAARETYAEALQLARINTGLYSAEQLPLIRAAIDANTRLKDWERVDKLQSLHLHISDRLYAPSEEEFLLAAQLYGEWKLRALRENLLQTSFRGLALSAEELSEFYGTILDELEADALAGEGIGSSEFLTLVFNKAETDLALIRALATTPYTEFAGTASPTVFQTRCRNARDSSGQLVQRCVNIQIENPRYAQSQRDAKQTAVSRQSRSIDQAIDRLEALRERTSDLSAAEREELDSRIAQLEVETQQLLRSSRSRTLF